MNINNNRQPSIIKSNNWKEIRENLKPGDAIPVNDQVYIENRSKELEAEITTLSEKMKNLRATKIVLDTASMASIFTFTAGICSALLNLMGPAIPYSFIGSTIAAGMISISASAIAKNRSDSSIFHTRVASEYAKKELYLLKNSGQIWKPGPDYVGPGINNN
mgnify:CR=1 FL=1